MLFVVAVVLHLMLPTQALAVNIALSPAQIPVLLLLIIGADGAAPCLITISFDFGLTPQIVSQTTE
jgi:hypothetical protein